MKNQRPISEQIEHEDVPFLDDLDPEPAQDDEFHYIAYSALAFICVAILWMVFA